MQRLDLTGISMGLNKAGTAAGTTSTYSTTATSQGIINGKHAAALSAQTNTASPTTDARTSAAFIALTDNQACVFVWGINLAGAIQAVQGPIVATEVGVTTTPGSMIGAAPFPTLPDDFYCIGYTLIQTAPSAADFTFGTSSWGATGITDTWVDIAVLPDRPVTF